MTAAPKSGAPKPPRVCFSLGVTGHRIDNAAYAANQARVLTVLREIFDAIDAVVAGEPILLGPAGATPTRLHSLLADGVDQQASNEALARGWEIVAPLPFGRDLNIAVSAKPETPAEARILIAGGSEGLSAETLARAERIRVLGTPERVFALADQDEVVAALYLAKLDKPDDARAADAFAAHTSERVGLAARVMIEQSDLLIGVWDGASQAFVGGTGHTIAVALRLGAPVLWIDAKAPERWRLLSTIESLAAVEAGEVDGADRMAALAALVREALRPAGEGETAEADVHAGARSLDAEAWRPRSDPLWHAYRRVEALFGGDGSPLRNLRQTYESPEAVATGSGAAVLAAMRALPGADPKLTGKVETDVLRRFVWADGVSARLSDAYRGGMIANFLFSALAIVSGVAYMPFGTGKEGAFFAPVEIAFLGAILGVTWLGQRGRWHGRWFETRRVAEYFRHSPILIALGVARAPGRWPKGAGTSWPEWYARYGLREVGLPRISMSRAYLRLALEHLLDDHVVRQRDYHEAKARRLTNVHRNLDSVSERLFVLAAVSVAASLLVTEGAAASIIPEAVVQAASKWFTMLDVLLPTFGGAVAGVRYFGDFERFAAISEVTAKKLDSVHGRIALLLAAPDAAIDYGLVADLAHAADDIVVSEIENWQAVFGSKNITVPA
ncbi:MAG TPA: hypothetical protein VKU90_06330 [Caulobacteraceae bacterium]|nr:hypothetical protein [Caulobacteraceae bacterium]